ncbi:ferredoxin-type protein NapF [Shimwellia blattae]|uniref:Ferredoxin-type protein NapF n=1 Tax=Shimwellia blattae (strain ATCC 29907 / DSM 4481 / JCM 1650 / NBRC 105725 / CDC 9005-74) TaxID=630626 RepID=I2B9N8_SHIBC|nr:ferredoxin-type protein NapF [Shimwellia blattae]AFJ47242.1 ferredoxin-type protein: electron transfer NapF [Shimwellia blattae DSM 4481 = NBRC 105725]GAB82229.1 iron-sulfur protein NapF [Shimwellia blattae DSM 4481 = NBRC 105725]VDY64734.1 ferredoxin-type protein [Shimwellia blattae]VEC22834.1 ferredoxin-type protein [Shimwellia blattae]
MVDRTRRGLLTGRSHSAMAGIRPPWSGHEAHFLAHCHRCDLCINACENQLLRRGPGGYPVVDFSRGECSFCYACAAACPRSLFLPREAHPWRLAVSPGSQCLTRNAVMCRSCEDNCPYGAITFRAQLSGISQPQLDNHACPGCGACVASCPVSAITVEYACDH